MADITASYSRSSLERSQSLQPFLSRIELQFRQRISFTRPSHANHSISDARHFPQMSPVGDGPPHFGQIASCKSMNYPDIIIEPQ